MVSVPSPSTAAAGAKILAATWNTDVRDAVQYFLDNIGGYGDSRNVIVNPYGSIWQASTSLAITSSATPQYHADQWCTRRSGTTGCTVSRQTGPTGQPYSIRIQRDSGNSSTTAIETMQPLETLASTPLAGLSCQLRLRMKSGGNFSASGSLVTVEVTYGTGTDQAPPASGWTGTGSALSTTQALTTTMTDFTFNSIAIPSNASQVQVLVKYTPVGTASTNDWFEIAGCQLTSGQAPGWERRAHAQELIMCQRFYETGSSRFDQYVHSGTLYGVLNYFRVTKRIAPTISQTNTSATNFGTTPSGGTITVDNFLTNRVATGTGGAVFAETWTASARL